jgi:hypothetical protein
MSNIKLPSVWQLEDKVQVVFNENAVLKSCKIIKVAFTEYGETRYDVEVPYHHYSDKDGQRMTSYFRIHGVDQYFLSYSQEDWDKINK